ncbi:MAG: serine/threonine protein kinase, partial [Acidobacteria bacterium]|nr:serine/threonine protein kinase [Acidobacteriota bacterium]MCA1643413.1 serine/threonine protein kinase [Acidobacteriota bacterium]
MELLEGRTLRDVLADEAPMAPARAVELMMQIAAAVEAAHDGGVIHRDLKPANIFVVQSKNLPPVIKVLDFGIAKLAAESYEDSGTHDLTQTGVMIGTPRYMSPEQCDGEHLSPAADVYSLGIIFYEMLTGATPFNGASPLAVALQHSTKPPRPPRELVPALPAELEEVVLRALAKNPDERPPDAGAFREELLATAQTLGLANFTVNFLPPENGAGNGGESNDGAPPADRLVISLEPLRASRDTNGHARGASRTGDTTMLANTAGQLRSTGAPAASTTAPEVLAAHAPGITRYDVTVPERRTVIQRMRQPVALIAVVVALLAFVAVAATLLRSRRGEAVGEASAVATTPSPSPSASPEPSPSPVNAADSGTAKTKRGAKPTTAAAQKKPDKGNRVVRTLKKIFKNPF